MKHIILVGGALSHDSVFAYTIVIQTWMVRNPRNEATYIDIVCWIYCRNDACVEGGESVLLDAFAVVEEMRKKHPQHFATLARVPTTFQRIHSKRLAT